MSTWKITIALLATTLALFASAPAAAQKHLNQAPGIDPRGQFSVGEIDAINLFNGALTVSIPLGPKYPVGPDFDYQLALVYNSGTWQSRRICPPDPITFGWSLVTYYWWQCTAAGCTITGGSEAPPNVSNQDEWTPHESDTCTERTYPSRGATAGLGWSLHFGILLPNRESWLDTAEGVNANFLSWLYLSPDGAEHFLPPQGFKSVDGTFLRLGGNECNRPDCLLLEHPNGIDEEYINLGSTVDPDIRMVERRDRFGNFLKVNYQSNPNDLTDLTHWTVTDSRERTHHIYLGAEGEPYQPVVQSVDLAAPDGQRLVYTLDHASCLISRAAPHNDPDVLRYMTAPFLREIQAASAAPDSPVLTRWQMPVTCTPEEQVSSAYDLDGSVSGAGTIGALREVILPTGAKTRWTYRPDEESLPAEPGFFRGYRYPDASSRRIRGRSNVGVWKKEILDAAGASLGKWTYNPLGEDIGPDRPPHCDPVNNAGGIPSTDSSCYQRHFKTRVIDAAGNRGEHYFSVYPLPDFEGDGEPLGWDFGDYGLPFWRDVSVQAPEGPLFLSSRTFDASNAVVSEHYVRYERDPGIFGDGEGQDLYLNHRVAAERTVFPLDGGRYREVVRSGWDGFGHFTTLVERGSANWPGSGGQASERTTELAYEIDEPSWMLEKLTRRAVSEGGETQAATWEYGRISEALPGSWVPTQNRVYKSENGAPSAFDRLMVFGYDTEGQLTSEKYYGGDRQSLAGGVPAKAGFRAEHTYQHGVRQSTTILDDCHNSAAVVKTLDLTIDDNTGLTTASRDAAGVATAYTYDLLGRPTEVKPAGISGTDYVYDLTNLQIKTTTGSCVSPGNCPFVRQSFLYLDGLGRVLQESNWWPNRGQSSPKYAQRQWQYDALGRTTRESTWRYNENDFNGIQAFASGWTDFLDFDAFNRATKVRPPEGSVHDATVSYTGHGEREVVKTAKVATGAAGAETAVSRTEVYDAFGRLIEVKEPSGANGAVVSTKYRYDVGNRWTRVETTAGAVTQVRAFEYDGLGQLRLETHPELGVSGNGSKAYDFYDVLGNPGSATIVGTSGAGLRSQAFRYDPAGRLIEVFGGGDLEHPLKQYFYSRQNASGTNKTQGKLVRTRRHHPELGLWIAESFEYGGAGGRLSKKVTSLTGQPEGPDAFSQSYSYNSLGELASISYPQCVSADATCVGATTGRTVDYGFNRGLLDSVTGFVPEIDYSANGRLARLKHANLVEELQDNDPQGQSRPEKIQVKKGASVLWDTSLYQYDGTGNIKAIGTETFQYDKVSRLIEGRVLQTAPSTFQTEALTFDAFGNITNRSVSGAANSAPAVTGATNRLTGGTYDASGNLLQLNATSTLHTFDVLDEMRARLDGSTTWQYLYTADGERVVERNPATGLMRWTLRGPGNQPLRILEDRGPGTWSLLRDYIYAGGRLVASVGTEGQRHYHLDHLGSVRLETDSAGNVVKQRTFLPFGEELASIPVSENELRFTGHERDDVVAGTSADDLDYMHARFCSPTLGRFLSVDPVLGRVGVPQSWNRYGYVRGNPVQLVDRNGEHPAAVVGVIAAVEVGFTAYDIYDTVSTINDPQESAFNKVLSGGGLAFGVFAPAGGYGKVAKIISSKLEKVPLIGRLLQKAPSTRMSRSLTKADLGISGEVQALQGTFSVVDRKATIHVDLLVGEVTNPFQIIKNAARTAADHGAETLRIEGTIVNERLLEILGKRYGLRSKGGTDYLDLSVGSLTSAGGSTP